MNITKWLQDEEGNLIKVDWQVIPTTPSDSRGYEIEGLQGKWLTIVSTFKEDAGKNILSVNPFKHPALENYVEISKEEAEFIQEQRRLAEEEADKENSKLRQFNILKNTIELKQQSIAKQTKILEAVKNKVIYEGDLELMTALHNFTEESLEKEKETVEELKKELWAL